MDSGTIVNLYLKWLSESSGTCPVLKAKRESMECNPTLEKALWKHERLEGHCILGSEGCPEGVNKCIKKKKKPSATSLQIF